MFVTLLPRLRHWRRPCVAGAALITTLSATAASAQARRLPGAVPSAATVAESTFASLSYRNIGPANMSGRMADVEGVAGDPSIIYVGSASGGVWKSTNAGADWTMLADLPAVLAVTCMVLHPTDPNTIYAGTGEECFFNNVEGSAMMKFFVRY